MAESRLSAELLLLLHVKLSAGVKELEEVLLDALLARRVVGLLLVVLLIKVLAVTAHVLHLHRGLVQSWRMEMLGQLWVLGLRSHPSHHGLKWPLFTGPLYMCLALLMTVHLSSPWVTTAKELTRKDAFIRPMHILHGVLTEVLVSLTLVRVHLIHI